MLSPMGSSTNFHATQPVFNSLDASITSEKLKYETMNASGIRRARNHVSSVMQSQEMPASTTTIFDSSGKKSPFMSITKDQERKFKLQ